jgi:multicomponent Na+:H+ antiporter subunit B
MTKSEILKIISQILLPFTLIFGFYIIFNGDTSPGGGFQGGVILATSYLLFAFITPEKSVKLKFLLNIEKILFLLILCFIMISFFTVKIPFTNFISVTEIYEKRIIYLIGLNMLIGLKVAIGLITLFMIFIEEGLK